MSSDNVQALTPGTRLGDYRLDAVIGHGGFGITYRSFDTQLAKFVAIKEYLPVEFAVRGGDGNVVPRGARFAEDFAWGRERFLDEARALARFRHLHIVPVLRYFEANGTAYTVMEFEDGKSVGELQVRGPWVAATYYDDPRASDSFTEDGWLRTGDMATVNEHGYIRLVDRTKDVIKSGGEWISSVDLENEIMAHPKVAEAAVIAVAHPKWQERPLACVVVKPGEELSKDEIIAFLEPRVVKWWLPDDIVFVDEVPKTSVGKFSKKDLRDQFADYELPTG